ncbi:MAG: hypothetical protein ACR2MN_13365 [Acidimicrobiales bacterium]
MISGLTSAMAGLDAAKISGVSNALAGLDAAKITGMTTAMAGIDTTKMIGGLTSAMAGLDADDIEGLWGSVPTQLRDMMATVDASSFSSAFDALVTTIDPNAPGNGSDFEQTAASRSQAVALALWVIVLLILLGAAIPEVVSTTTDAVSGVMEGVGLGYQLAAATYDQSPVLNDIYNCIGFISTIAFVKSSVGRARARRTRRDSPPPSANEAS